MGQHFHKCFRPTLIYSIVHFWGSVQKYVLPWDNASPDSCAGPFFGFVEKYTPLKATFVNQKITNFQQQAKLGN